MIYLVYMLFVLKGEPQIEVVGNELTYTECYKTYVAKAVERSKELNIPVWGFSMGCGTFPIVLPK